MYNCDKGPFDDVCRFGSVCVRTCCGGVTIETGDPHTI